MKLGSTQNKDVTVDDAERAVNRAFSTGKADRAAITRQAQLDAEEAVEKAGIAMESDEMADDAARLAVIAANMGNSENARIARDREREARRKAKADHAAATKSAKRAYDAIKFSDPSKLGFMRVVQFGFFMHIASTLLVLILTSRDTVVYSSVNLLNWVQVVFESVAFYFFVNRYKIGRPFVIGMSAFYIVVNVVTQAVNGTFSIGETVLNNLYYIFLILYFMFSERVKAVLVNDLSSEEGEERTDELVIDRKSWQFWRNQLVYFVVFSVLGHWMEAGMCQFIRLGLVQGEYDPTNTMLWRDWLYPYPMEGAAVVLIALLLYPLYIELKKRCKPRWVAYAISFVANALMCSLIELIGGLMFNAQHQNWDYSEIPFNFMGQVCLQNAVAFGVAASLIAWYVYPALERHIARIRPATMNIIAVVIAIAGGILFSLYAIAPPEGLDLGERQREVLESKADPDVEALRTQAELARGLVDAIRSDLAKPETLTQEEQDELAAHLEAAEQELAQIEGLLREHNESLDAASGTGQ